MQSALDSFGVDRLVGRSWRVEISCTGSKARSDRLPSPPPTERVAANSGKSYDEWASATAKAVNIPLGRVGEAEEAAETINFLVSPASSFLTGIAVNIDGGASPVL